MLTAFAFTKVAVTVEDIWFFDPDAPPGEEGAERGVRVEVRLVERLPRTGTRYAAYPVHLETAVWRADLFDSVKAGVGARDRMHYHPQMSDDEPGDRAFDPLIRADPFGWLERALADPAKLLAERVSDSEIYPGDMEQWRLALPQIVDAARLSMQRVHAGVLAQQPA